MVPGGFTEPSVADEQALLDAELRDGISRNDLIEGMERLSRFCEGGTTYTWKNGTEALVVGTMARSARTYRGICLLLRAL